MKNKHRSPRAYAERVDAFFSRMKRMPSYSEATKLFNVQSKDTAYRIMQNLVKIGAVGKSAGGKIVPNLRTTKDISLPGQGYKTKDVHKKTTPNNHKPFFLRMLGLVEAGFPTPAEESLQEEVSLDEWLIPKREASFMLRVKGESMRDAGIHDGDMVIAERTMEAKVGSIVIAEIDGEWTLKTLRKDRQGMYLEPANADFPPIMRPQRSLKVSAVVRGVVRKY